jgi:hypothetical protein
MKAVVVFEDGLTEDRIVSLLMDVLGDMSARMLAEESAASTDGVCPSQPPTPGSPKLPPEEEIQNHIACAGIGLGPDLIDKRREVIHLCYEYIRRQLRASA